MAGSRHRVVAVLGLVATALVLPPGQATVAQAHPTPDRSARPDGPVSSVPAAPTATSRGQTTFPGTSPRADRTRTRLEQQTSLTVTIDSINPAALRPGEPVQVSGEVTNLGDTQWQDANVYLDVAQSATTTLAELAAIQDSGDVFGDRIVKLGLFEELGDVDPGTTTPYRLKIPYGALGISATSGVYRIGVSVVAGDRDGRDDRAHAETLMPLRPDADSNLTPTRTVTLVPVTYPVIRHVGGNFVDERLANAMSSEGQLRHLLDFANQAPAGTLQLVADPALLQAVRDMADGYTVTTIGQENGDGGSGRNGTGREAATQWLADFDRAASRQQLLLAAWGLPDSSGFARAHMPSVVEAAVTASEDYAVAQRLLAPVVNWQLFGASTRRGLVVARRSGADTQVVAADDLVNLRSSPESSYPPSLVEVPTSQGPLTAVVYGRTVAGRPFNSHLRALDFRQSLMAEATVRALSDSADSRQWVVAAPFGWDPGPGAGDVRLTTGYRFPTVAPIDLATATRNQPTAYPGPIAPTAAQPPIPSLLVAAVRRFQATGRTSTDLLTDKSTAVVDFDRRLASAGTSQWARRPKLQLALVRRANRLAAESLTKVTVTGPAFVALSSASGPFPLTVTNGLDVGVTVRVNVTPGNPALKIAPIEPLRLEPGESADIQASMSADSSGVTQVRVRLATLTGRVVGPPSEFDVRATQIGVAIWIVIALGSAVVLVAAAFQIIRRIRTTGLTPREKPSP
ncbi:MAG: DUF6049 family protein [Nocardioidaceae bacterium]